jgi:hypothetical protein
MRLRRVFANALRTTPSTSRVWWIGFSEDDAVNAAEPPKL